MVDRKELDAIVGIENVFDDLDILEQYSEDQSFSHHVRPSCVIRPHTLEEVQGIVQWANNTQTPLIPISSGRPRFHGGSIPGVGGVVIVDMSRMKKVIRLDRKNRVALVEPGVTFGELIPELAKEDLAPFLPLVPRQSKSVVASVIEREPITMPRYHWEPQDPLRCLEVVFGSGDLFRTGSAAGPGSLEEQWAYGKAQTRPYGPSFTDFAKIIQGSQGSMGIVTWASIACRPLPQFKNAYFIPSDNLNALVDLTYKVLWKKLGQDCFILNKRQLMSMLSAEIPSSDYQYLPPWILFISIEGFGLLPEERVAYQETDLFSTAQSFGLTTDTVLSGVDARRVADILSQPSPEPYWKMEQKGGCHDIFFLTNLERTPGFVTDFTDMVSSYQYPSADIGVYIQPTVQGVSCHCEFSLYYDPDKQNEEEAIKQINSSVPRTLAANGAFFSRPYATWADFAYGQNAQTVIMQRKIKEMFDPKGIMNPSKLCF